MDICYAALKIFDFQRSVAYIQDYSYTYSMTVVSSLNNVSLSLDLPSTDVGIRTYILTLERHSNAARHVC